MLRRKSVLGRLALFGTTLIWGTSFVILKNTLEHVGTFWVLAIRFSVAALLLGLIAGRRRLTVDRRCLRGSILLGVFIAMAYIVQTFGLKYTTPGKNAFLTSVYCVLVPFLGWAIYRKKPDIYNIAAAFLCITGIGLVSLSGGERGLNFGDLLTLLCGIFYALQIIVMDRYVSDGDALAISVIQFASAAVICWAGAFLFEEAPRGLPPGSWISILYLAVACTGICFFLEAWGIKYTPASTAAVIMTFEAVFGTFFSVLFYHEALTFRLVLGFALIFFSVIVSETKLRFRSGKEKSSAH